MSRTRSIRSSITHYPDHRLGDFCQKCGRGVHYVALIEENRILPRVQGLQTSGDNLLDLVGIAIMETKSKPGVPNCRTGPSCTNEDCLFGWKMPRGLNLIFKDRVLPRLQGLQTSGESLLDLMGDGGSPKEQAVDTLPFRNIHLPAELRLVILELLLLNEGPITNPRRVRSSIGAPPRCTIDSTILRVSSQLYNEGWPLLYECNVFEFTSERSFIEWISRGPHINHAQGIHHLILNIELSEWSWWHYPSRTTSTTRELINFYKNLWWPFNGCRCFRYFKNLKSLTFVLGENIAFRDDLSSIVPDLVEWIKGVFEEEKIRDSRVEHAMLSYPKTVEFRATPHSIEPSINEIFRPITSLLKERSSI